MNTPAPQTIASSKPRRDCFAMRLSPDLLAQLHDWLLDGRSYEDILTDLANPPFSIETSVGAISNYYQRHVLTTRAVESIASASQLPDLQNGLLPLIHQAAIATAVETQLDHRALNALTRYYRIRTDHHLKKRLATQRDLQLQLNRDRLVHHRRVFEFNAARAALIHALKLQTIANDPTMDDEQKVWASRKILFPDTAAQTQPKTLDQFIQ